MTQKEGTQLFCNYNYRIFEIILGVQKVHSFRVGFLQFASTKARFLEVALMVSFSILMAIGANVQ